MNAKDLLDQVRDNINEASEGHWDDVGLLRRMNFIQRRIGMLFMESRGQWLLKRATVSPSDSVISLPSDCAKPVYLEEISSGVPISWLGGVSYRRLSRETEQSIGDVVSPEAYILEKTIEVNRDSYSNDCYLWYLRRVPDLHCGTAGSGSGADTLEFASDRNLVLEDDYYNGVIVEVIDQSSGIVDIRSEITDYDASSREATISGTPASGDIYGTVSVLPEEAMELLVLDTTLWALMKPGSVVDEKVLGYYRDERNRARSMLEDWLATRVIEGNEMVFGDIY